MFNTCVQCHMSSAVTEQDHAWTPRRHNLADPVKENCVPATARTSPRPSRAAIRRSSTSSRSGPATSPTMTPTGTPANPSATRSTVSRTVLAAQIEDYVAEHRRRDRLRPGVSSIKDLNGNGVLDANESDEREPLPGQRHLAQGRVQPPGQHAGGAHGFIHNALYTAQLLVDSFQTSAENLGPFTWR